MGIAIIQEYLFLKFFPKKRVIAISFPLGIAHQLTLTQKPTTSLLSHTL